MRKLITLTTGLTLGTAAAQTWLPGTNYPGLNPQAGVVLDMGLVALSGFLAHKLTAFLKGRIAMTTFSTRGVALGLSALINGGAQAYMAHSFSLPTIINWVLGSVFTWFVADGIFMGKVQATASGTATASKDAPQ